MGGYHTEIPMDLAEFMWSCFTIHQSTNRPLGPTIDFFAHAALYLGRVSSMP